MKIVIQATKIKLNQALRDFIEEKIGELGKFFQKKPSKTFVEIEKTTRHHKKGPFFRAECQITVPGKKSLRAEAKSFDLRLAIVEVKDEMQRQLKKYKEKYITRTRKKHGTKKVFSYQGSGGPQRPPSFF